VMGSNGINLHVHTWMINACCLLLCDSTSFTNGSISMVLLYVSLCDKHVIPLEISTLAQSCSDLPGLPQHHLPPSPARLAMAIAGIAGWLGHAMASAAAPLPLVALIRRVSSRR